MIEKLVHLVIDTHVAPCHVGRCMAFKLRVNTSRWAAYTTKSCQKCHPRRQLGNQGVDTWHLEDYDFSTWFPAAYSPSLSAELVTLLLNPFSGWRSPPSLGRPGRLLRRSHPHGCRSAPPLVCTTCGKDQLERTSYASASGPFFILFAAFYSDICTCGFGCIWRL